MQINNFLVNNKNIIFFGELRFDEKIVFGKIGFYDFRSDPELDPDPYKNETDPQHCK